VLDDAGHAPQMEAPGELVDATARWLATLPAEVAGQAGSQL
jgi:pimeloyl-ACP methyl ester carboxylesterase